MFSMYLIEEPFIIIKNFFSSRLVIFDKSVQSIAVELPKKELHSVHLKYKKITYLNEENS